MQSLIADLEKYIGKEQVKFDQMTRLLYSTDASNYQMMPIGVTFPRSADDVIAIHEVARQHQMPVLPRGSGSSLAGQTVGQAIVMDFTRYMRRVRGINAEAQTVLVEPGLVLGQLNKQMQPMGFMFGPDPASAERAAIGGCIGNNATGAHSILYGMTSDNILRLEVVLPSGEQVWLDADTPQMTQIREKISQLVTENQAEITNRYPKTWRTSAGYALNKIDPSNVDLKWLLAGSEGTLATIVQAELRLVPRPPLRRLAMLHFDTLRASLEATPRILETQPAAIELIDRFLLDKTRQHAGFAPLLNFVEGDPAALLAVEYYGASDTELSAKVESLKMLLNRIGYKGSMVLAITPQEQANVWKVRKAGLGLLMSQRGDTKPIDLIEDAAVPVEYLADYIDEVEQIIHKAGTTFAIYAHASAGCLHVRPMINLKSEAGLKQYRRIGSEVADAVVKYGGTISGEHGTGIIRGEFSDRLFGEKLTQAFREVKAAFDPQNLMNPGKMVDHPAMDDVSLMRHTPYEVVIPIEKTRYDWSADGGFFGAIEMCNGAGVCRKEGAGTMCPSYMATLDEAHATRGRANALRHTMLGHLKPTNFASDELHGVFDLCLACKACKAECPSSVDVARMKAEYLSLRYDAKGYVPLATRIFANIHRLNALGSILPSFANLMLTNPLGFWLANMMGLPTQRPLPLLAKQRFSRSVHKQPNSAEVTLIVDTFTEFNHPEVGHALIKIMDALGIKINIVRMPTCCGRPAISKGLLDMAKRMANQNVEFLSQNLTPFIFLEPSCQSALMDDYPELVSPEYKEAAKQVAAHCMSAEAWLLPVLQSQQDTLVWDTRPREVLLHGHCHQKALWGTAETRQLLSLIPNTTVSEIDSGCCGVAGSFGYEHYDLSLKIANDRLLPALREKPQAIAAAPGTSCRVQISEAGHSVLHPIQVIGDALLPLKRGI